MLWAAVLCGRGSSGSMQGLAECRGVQGTKAQARAGRGSEILIENEGGFL